MTEHFGHIKIDNPRPAPTDGAQPLTGTEGRPRPATPDGGQPLTGTEGRPQPATSSTDQKPAGLHCAPGISPGSDGLPIQASTIQELCDALGITIDSRGGRRRDRELLVTLAYRLYRQGLRMGRSIIGKAIPKPDEQVYVYPIQYGEPPKRGTLPPSLFLTAWLVAADGVTPRDLDIIDAWLIKSVGSRDEAIPAMATVRWLTHRRLILTAWRKTRCESLSKFVHRRAALVDLMLTLVADGPLISPARLSRLQTIYGLIGLDPADIHSDLHRASTTGQSAQRPLTGKSPSISQQRLSQMAADTAKAQAILSQVFTDGDDSPVGEPPCSARQRREDPLVAILTELIERSSWPREDFDRLARERHQTPGALLETLNDLAYDTVGDPVAEAEDDAIIIDLAVAQEIIDKLLKNHG